MEIIIRTAHIEDLEEVTALVGQSVRGLQKIDYDSNTILKAMELVTGLDKLINLRQLFVAECSDCIIGCGGFSLINEDNIYAELKSYFVLPEYSRMGVSTKLLNYSINRCVEEGVSLLRVAATLTGVPFYKKNGFTVTREYDHALSDGSSFRMVEMERISAP